MNGSIAVGDSSTTHNSFHTLVLSADGQETGVSVTALENNTDFILVWIIRVVGGNFVHSCRMLRSPESRSTRTSCSTVHS